MNFFSVEQQSVGDDGVTVRLPGGRPCTIPVAGEQPMKRWSWAFVLSIYSWMKTAR